ncbi:MAG TPA: hypothetical protein VNU46_07505, partial [Gemmatimonadaceae bacterium]|nr:hypothetical protein [Gemmatimonadaceae bacterium]
VVTSGRDGSDTGGITRTWRLTPPVRGDEGWPSLAAALLELREMMVPSLSPTPGALAIALLPGLVQVRRIDLPKMRADKLRKLLSRNAGRYFPTVSEPQLADGWAVARSSPVPYVTAAAPLRIIEAIVRGAHDAGFRVATIVSAYGAWVAAARRRWPTLRREDGSVAVAAGTHVDILYIERGQLAGVRKLQGRSETEDDTTYELQQPEETAARYAADAEGPELLPEALYRARGESRRRILVSGGTALAATILLVAGGVLWQAHRTLREVTMARDSLRTQVDHVIDAEHHMTVLGVALAGLKRVEAQGVRWSDVIADMSDNLPPDAYLVIFRAHHDSVSADGIAAKGAGVFERLDGAKLLDHVQAAGPIRRDAKRGAAPIERFTVAARVSGGVPPYTQPEKP